MAVDDGIARKLAARLSNLQNRFLALSVDADRQAAGRALNHLLADMFDVFGLVPSEPFRVVGEEIDGAFIFQNETYLLEAKWTAEQTKAANIYAFEGKVRRKSDYTRAVFISINGFTLDALEAYQRGQPARAVLLDGAHLFRVLAGHITLEDLLRRTTRHLSQTGTPYLPASEL